MKKFVIIMALALVTVLAFVPVYAEAVDLGDSGDVTLDPDGDTEEVTDEENVNKFNEVMTELYEYWQEYNTTEGGNTFEKLVNFAWKYRGDVGGVAAAIAVVVFLLFMALRFMPRISRYSEYIYKGNAETKEEIMNGVTGEIAKYAPALATVESVAAMYPKFEALVTALTDENREMKEQVTRMGMQVAETEKRHAAEMKLQGETFRDIITLSALPVGKKTELMEKYRLIENAASDTEETV
ncbi:MAG: hypothetical protein IJY04_09445 [Clostridia bacterium]|nr:hypothetical protein [Clostridia bacterium]